MKYLLFFILLINNYTYNDFKCKFHKYKCEVNIHIKLSHKRHDDIAEINYCKFKDFTTINYIIYKPKAPKIKNESDIAEFRNHKRYLLISSILKNTKKEKYDKWKKYIKFKIMVGVDVKGKKRYVTIDRRAPTYNEYLKLWKQAQNKLP